jgi:hypothetical protein
VVVGERDVRGRIDVRGVDRERGAGLAQRGLRIGRRRRECLLGDREVLVDLDLGLAGCDVEVRRDHRWRRAVGRRSTAGVATARDAAGARRATGAGRAAGPAGAIPDRVLVVHRLRVAAPRSARGGRGLALGAAAAARSGDRNRKQESPEPQGHAR